MKNSSAGRRISTFLLFVILGTAFLSTAAWWPPEFLKKLIAPPLETGIAAPQFELETLSGKKVSLKEFEGKPVLLKFWNKG
jgi:cytochrome oxidase Cu insertion factor (SCO1/SenC/PrrC family)